MRYNRVFLSLLLTSSLFATEVPFDCSDVHHAQLSLSVHAANLANVISTRTPEGGAYKRKELRRTESGGFDIFSAGDFKLVYEPSHPDANKDGFVSYPNISKMIERAGIVAAADKLILMARAKICGLSLLPSKMSNLVKYGSDSEIRSDFFIIGNDGKIVNWTRELKSGEEQITSLGSQAPTI